MEELAMATARCLNALGLLAAPKAWQAAVAGGDGTELRKGIFDSIEVFLAAVSQQGPSGTVTLITGSPDAQILSRNLTQLKSELDTWSSSAPTSTLVQLARDNLELLGVPEPHDGWDTFEPDAM